MIRETSEELLDNRGAAGVGCSRHGRWWPDTLGPQENGTRLGLVRSVRSKRHTCGVAS